MYGNVVLLIVVPSIRKRFSCFLEKVFVFWKTYFNVKILKTFKIFSDCHIKICLSLKQSAILKIASIPIAIFLLALKWNLYGYLFSCDKTKTNSGLAVKFVERSDRPFSVCFIKYVGSLSLSTLLVNNFYRAIKNMNHVTICRAKCIVTFYRQVVLVMAQRRKVKNSQFQKWR